MLTKQGCEIRRARMWESLPPDVAWVLVADPRHVNYLANFCVEPLSFSADERALLLLDRNGAAVLLGDNFTLRKSSSDPLVDETIIEDWYNHRDSVVNRDHALFAALGRVADRVAGRPGMLEREWLPVGASDALGISEYPAELQSLGSLLRELRRRKEDDELSLLSRCMRATEAGHRRALEVVRPGVAELEMYTEIASAAMAEAGRACVVYGDFRAATAAQPKAGGLPTEYELQAGDLFILDYSVVINGYRSDFTNTLAVGEPTLEQQQLFAACCDALAAGQALLCSGTPGDKVYLAVSDALTDAGYGPLRHHAGHGLGLAHPEPPILTPESDDKLQEGDVVTLEPGAYVEGVGGVRVEHNYLITGTGAEKLSRHTLKLR